MMQMRRMASLSASDRLRNRFLSLAATFAKTDRILSGRRDIDVACKSLGPTKAPGYSDGRVVYINVDAFPSITDIKTLVRLTGLNYHELAHILYTPRSGSQLARAVKAEGLFQSFNALEDQRIETLFTAEYWNAARYFTEMVVGFLMTDDTTWGQAFPLTHGRRFLPLDIRMEFEKRFSGDDTLRDNFKRVIDQYRLLDVASQGHDALLLIREYDALCRQLSGQMPQQPQPGDPQGHEGCSDMGQGSPSATATRSAIKKAGGKTKEQDSKEEQGQDGSGFYNEEKENDEQDGSGSGEDSEPSDGDEDDQADASDDGDEDGADGDDGEGDDSDDTDGDDSDEDDDTGQDGDSGESGSDGDSDDSTGGGGRQAGGGTSTGTTALDDEGLRDLLESIMEDAINSEEVQSDARRLRQAVSNDKNLDAEGRTEKGRHHAARPEHVQASRDIQKELDRLHAKVEPGWNYGSDAGRLNTQRAMSASYDDEDIFDEWDEGREEAVGLEVVILLDQSGSMSGQSIIRASEAMSMLKRSLDNADGHCTVIGFGSANQHRVLFSRREKLGRTEGVTFDAPDGDTHPTSALEQAQRVLATSTMPNKLLVIITDGQWSDTYRSEQIIGAMPATTLLIGIDAGGSDPHKCDLFREIHNPQDIVTIVKSTVTMMLNRAVSR